MSYQLGWTLFVLIKMNVAVVDDEAVPALCSVSASAVGGSPSGSVVCSETRSGLGSGHRGCSGHDWQHNQSSRGSGHPSVKKTVTTHQHSPPTTEPNVHLKWPT